MVTSVLRAGFPVEIMDGDNNHIPREFRSALFNYMQKHLNNGKNEDQIKVISVIGTQSSHKSTLLNTMFGCNFGVSAG